MGSCKVVSQSLDEYRQIVKMINSVIRDQIFRRIKGRRNEFVVMKENIDMALKNVEEVITYISAKGKAPGQTVHEIRDAVWKEFPEKMTPEKAHHSHCKMQ